MTNLTNFDRDLMGFRLGVRSAFSSSFLIGADVVARSDGTVVVDQASGSCFSNALNLAARSSVAFGCYVTGPDQTSGSCYRFRGFASASVADVHCTAFVGAGDGTVSTFDTLPESDFVGCSLGSLHFDDCLNVQPFGTVGGVDLSARPLMAGFVLSNPSGAAVDADLRCYVSVQRLATRPPFFNSSVR